MLVPKSEHGVLEGAPLDFGEKGGEFLVSSQLPPLRYSGTLRAFSGEDAPEQAKNLRQLCQICAPLGNNRKFSFAGDCPGL